MNVESARAIGAFIQGLRNKVEQMEREKADEAGTSGRVSEQAVMNMNQQEDGRVVGTAPDMHPKAVGSLLKFMQSDKDKYYEDPPVEKSEVKIFTPNYGVRVELDDSEYDEEEFYEEPSAKRNKKETSLEDFYCTLCDVACTSQIVLDTHLIGRKHMKRVEKLKSMTNAFASNGTTVHEQQQPPLGKPADIQQEFDQLALNEPLVGLEYVTEYRRLGGSDHRYFCEMCLLKCNLDQMLQHVTSGKHRLRFMRTHCFDMYYKITDFPNFENIMKASQAEQLLRQHSSFVIRRLQNGKPRLCKVKPYTGEGNMRIDVQKYKLAGEVHPSKHADLPKAEMLLQKQQALEKAEAFRKRQEAEVEKRQEIEQRRMNNRPIPSSSSRHLLEEHNQGDYSDGELLGYTDRDLLLAELLTTNSLETDMIESTLRAEHVKKLKEQELRLVNALRKLRESSGGLGMTIEELVAEEKLRTLLTSIRAEKRRYLLLNKIKAPELELSAGPPPAAPQRLAHPQAINRSVPRGRNERPQQPTRRNMSAIQDEVEPIIEKTRQQVEQKIFQALSGGSLSQLTEAFKNNPDLQASLKQWEMQQAGKSTSGISNPIPQGDAYGASSRQQRPFINNPVDRHQFAPNRFHGPEKKLPNPRLGQRMPGSVEQNPLRRQLAHAPPHPRPGHPHPRSLLTAGPGDHSSIARKRALLRNAQTEGGLMRSSLVDRPSTSHNPLGGPAHGFGHYNSSYGAGESDYYTDTQSELSRRHGLLGSRPQFTGQSGRIRFQNPANRPGFY